MRQAGRLMGCFRSSLRSIVYSVRGVAYVLESNMKRLFLFLPLVPAVAWSDDFPQYDGSEIVVTASRIPEPVSSAIGDISVITQAEIEKSGQSTLVELLRTQPGVEITSSGGFGQISAVQMRGASSRHTLVLIDGMRIDSASAGTTAFQNIPLDQIESAVPRRVADKNQLLLLHCASGMRSGMAKSKLKAMGYANAYNLGSYSRAAGIVNAR